MEFYKILSQRRKELGMSYDELSGKSSVPVSTLKKIMTGVTKAPQFETLRAVSYALNLTLNDLDDQELSSIAPLNNNEALIISIYRCLNATGQAALIKQANYLYADPDMKKDGESNSVTA